MNYRSFFSTLTLTLLLQVPIVFLSSCSKPNFLQQNSSNVPEQYKDQEDLSGIAKTIRDKAEQFIVRIDYPSGNGSGVIVAKNGETYYVLTAQHVVENQEEYEIVTPDGKNHKVDSSDITTKGSADLAVVQFQSGETYQVATLADYKTELEENQENQQQESGEQMKEIENNNKLDEELVDKATSVDEMSQIISESSKKSQEFLEKMQKDSQQELKNLQKPQYVNQWLFLLGWSRFGDSPLLSLSAGKDFTQRMSSLFGQNNKVTFASNAFDTLAREKRYELNYSNFSQGGMSGGAVLDTMGRVVGIHTAAEGERVGLGEIQLGLSLGVPIKAFLSIANQMGIQPEWLKVEKVRPQPITKEDEQSIADNLFELKPPGQNGTEIDWLNYGNDLMRIERFPEATVAFDEAIKRKPDFYQAYYAKGLVVQWQEGKKSLAETTKMSTEIPSVEELSSTDQVNNKYITESQQSSASMTQGMSKALPYFKKASEIEPDFYPAWKQQGSIYSIEMSSENMSQLGNAELTGTTAPNSTPPLSPQATLAGKKALAAYNKATALNPSDSMLYSSKAYLLAELSRPQEAIEAYSQAIKIDPTSIMGYHGRSIVYCQIGNKQKAEADLNSAKKLGDVNYAQDEPVCGS